jgi:hypothetical protein
LLAACSIHSPGTPRYQCSRFQGSIPKPTEWINPRAFQISSCHLSFIHLPPEDLMACICSVLYGTPHTALLSFLVRCCMDKWVSVCAPMSDGGHLDIFPVLGGRSPCHQPVQPAFTLHTCVVAYNSVAVCSLSAASNAWAM